MPPSANLKVVRGSVVGHRQRVEILSSGCESEVEVPVQEHADGERHVRFVGRVRQRPRQPVVGQSGAVSSQISALNSPNKPLQPGVLNHPNESLDQPQTLPPNRKRSASACVVVFQCLIEGV